MRIEIEREGEGEFPAGWEFTFFWHDGGERGAQLYVTDEQATAWGLDTSKPEMLLVGILRRAADAEAS